MLIKHIVVLMAAAALGLLSSLEASANSRFTIENDSYAKVTVQIYSGGDGSCKSPEKTKTASAGETDSYGCTGNGKNRCKVKLRVDGDRICKTQMNTCDDTAQKIDNGDRIVITMPKSGSYECAFN